MRIKQSAIPILRSAIEGHLTMIESRTNAIAFQELYILEAGPHFTMFERSQVTPLRNQPVLAGGRMLAPARLC